jgi:transcriptional regulator of PTS gene
MRGRKNLGNIHVLDFETLLQANLREKDRAKILILKFIQETGYVSRKMVVENLSMRPSTVSKSIVEMIEDGLIVELQTKANSGRGRPEWLLKLEKDRFWVVSFSIMSVSLIATIVNLAGDIVDEIVVKPDKNLDAEAMATIFNGLITEFQQKAPVGTSLLGYGFAVPGLIDKQAELWRMVSRFPRVRNLRFEQVMGYQEGNVFFERNIDAILNHCLVSDPSSRVGISLLLHWGYGIAISCAVNGTLIQSVGGLFGEIGHWTSTVEKETTETLESMAAVPKYMNMYHWNEMLDESAIQRSVDDGFVSDSDLEQITSVIIRVLRNLHLAYFPSTIYLLSPFVNQARANEISRQLEILLEPFEVHAPHVLVLEYSAHSESLGMANTVFTRTIQPHLIARW